MGQCLPTNTSKLSKQLAIQSHRQIELHLRDHKSIKTRVFFTGSPECIMNIFTTINGKFKPQNAPKLLVGGYIRKLIIQCNFYIPSELQKLCTIFFGKIQPPNHYEFAPLIYTPTQSYSPTLSKDSNSSNSTSIGSYDDIDINSIGSKSQLNVTYHNLQCFHKNKKDYYLKWIHLLDNSLSVIFVSDLSHIKMDKKLLLKDMEKFKRLMFYSNGKYNSCMHILILCGVTKFEECLTSNEMYRKHFEKQFDQFKFDESKNSYSQQAMQYIKDKYVSMFEDNLRNAYIHWNRKRMASHQLFVRTINDVYDGIEVQNVWIKLNRALIHGNVMHELRTGGIAF